MIKKDGCLNISPIIYIPSHKEYKNIRTQARVNAWRYIISPW